MVQGWHGQAQPGHYVDQYPIVRHDGGMLRGRVTSRRRAVVTAIVGVILCLIGLGLGIVLLSRGLDIADKVASVVSMAVGIASLVVTVVALRRSGRSPGNTVRSESEHGTVEGTVTGLEVTGPASALPNVVHTMRTGDVGPGGSVTGAHITLDPNTSGRSGNDG